MELAAFDGSKGGESKDESKVDECAQPKLHRPWQDITLTRLRQRQPPRLRQRLGAAEWFLVAPGFLAHVQSSFALPECFYVYTFFIVYLFIGLFIYGFFFGYFYLYLYLYVIYIYISIYIYLCM